jgi:hypothetical protein
VKNQPAADRGAVHRKALPARGYSVREAPVQI